MKIFLHDWINFFTKLKLRKIINAGKVYLSYQLAKMTNQPVQWGMPISVSIEPTTACNLKCPECPSGLRAFTRDQGNLGKDFFRHTIDQIADKLIYLIFYFQGEPFINPRFLEMVAYARQKGIYTISSTNGHFLDDHNARKTVQSGLDRLIISIDGLTQEVYESYRKGGDLNKVLEGTKNLIYWKKKLNSRTPHTIFQFLVVKQNEHQIEEVYHLAKEMGIDEVKLKTAQLYDFKNGNPLIPTLEKYSRYRQVKNGEYVLKRQVKNSCWKMWHSCVVTWDGNVVPCCFDKDADFVLGALKETGFKKIWYGVEYQEFRSKLWSGRDQIQICSNCSEGCKVWI